ncbi:MAG TPA: molybdopterin oxidoreductase family protein [Solirubrobacterales bacterium]|nr:molybdopterin oxidoreductase family protein [Solirubrobacterales bacterium]
MASVANGGTRVVRGACPHDCPDTCAMLTTVDESGRAIAIAGDPDHPITAGFLCGKVSNYLDRVYSEDRILHPLVRTGAKGAGEFRRASWEEAIDVAAAGLEKAIAEHGGEAVLPYSYMGTQGALQSGSIANRFMNAIGATDLVRTICASAGVAGVVATHGLSPEVDPEEWPHARYVLIWGWNPMSTAPHLWRKLLDARANGAKLVVVDPFRSRTANVADEHLRPLPGTDAALGLGMMRAVLDAGLVDEEWCRAHADGFDELIARLEEHDVDHWAGVCGVDAMTIDRVGREFASTQPALLRLGVGAQRHMGAPIAYRTLACLPALVGAWRHRGGGCSYIPTATATAVPSAVLDGMDMRSGEPRQINMSQLGEALTDPELDPPVKAMVVWSSNPAQIAPDQERVLAGLEREDLHLVVIEQFMTDTARYADVVLPATTELEHLDGVFSWGHHYFTLNQPAIEPLGESKPTTEAFRLLAARMGLEDPAFAETDEELLQRLLDGNPGGVELERLRGRGWHKIDLGQGPTPHAEGGFGTPTGKLGLNAAWLGDAGVDTLPFYDPPAEVADEELAGRLPLAMLTPKTHLFLNSTFANQRRQHSAQPEPHLIINPEDAAARGITDGATVRVFNDRGSFSCVARVSDDTRSGVVVAPMGWWNADYLDGRSSQVTTPQRLTPLGAAPTFNDNRVEVEALPPA